MIARLNEDERAKALAHLSNWTAITDPDGLSRRFTNTLRDGDVRVAPNFVIIAQFHHRG